MAVTTILASSPTVTGITLTAGSAPSGAASLDFQIGTKSDFKFCVAPIYNVLTGSYTSPFTIGGLNQRTSYYVRARWRYTSGAVDPWPTNPTPFRTANGTARDLTLKTPMIKPATVLVPVEVTQWASSNELAAFPTSNLAIDGPVIAKQIGSSSRPFLEIYARVGYSLVDTIAILGTNLAEAMTLVSVSADNNKTTLAGSSPAYSQTFTAFRASPNLDQRDGYHGLLTLPAAISYDWIRIVVQPVEAIDFTFVATHCVLGLNRASKNMSNATKSPSPLTTIQRRPSGQPLRSRGLPMRKETFDVALETEAQFEGLHQDLVKMGNNRIFAIPNSNPGSFLHDRMLYGDLVDASIAMTGSLFYTLSLGVNSII